MPKEESDGAALGALLAPSAGLFAGKKFSVFSREIFRNLFLRTSIAAIIKRR